MKKVAIFILLLAFTLTACSCGTRILCGGSPRAVPQTSFHSLTFGMTYSDVDRLTTEHLVEGYYVFTKNAAGDAVIGRFDPDTLKIARITEYPAVTGDADAFASLTPGMTVYEVVRTVGLPLGSRTFGLCTLDFACSDGSEYRVTWNDDMTVLAVAPVPD